MKCYECRREDRDRDAVQAGRAAAPGQAVSVRDLSSGAEPIEQDDWDSSGAFNVEFLFLTSVRET